MSEPGGREQALARLAQAESLSREMTRRARGGALSYLAVGVLLGATTFAAGYLWPRPGMGVPVVVDGTIALVLTVLLIGLYGSAHQSVRAPVRPVLVVLPLTGGALAVVMQVAGGLAAASGIAVWLLLSVPPVPPLLVAGWLERRR